MDKAFWKSRTFWGAVIYAIGSVATAPADQRPTAIVQALGVVLGAVGLRSAVAKNGTGQ